MPWETCPKCRGRGNIVDIEDARQPLIGRIVFKECAYCKGSGKKGTEALTRKFGTETFSRYGKTTGGTRGLPDPVIP